MLVCVTFNVGMRDVCYVDGALRGKKFQKKKASFPLYLLLPMLVSGKLCGCRRQGVSGDVNESEGCKVSLDSCC
jgi:hypothetical protein